MSSDIAAQPNACDPPQPVDNAGVNGSVEAVEHVSDARVDASSDRKGSGKEHSRKRTRLSKENPRRPRVKHTNRRSPADKDVHPTPPTGTKNTHEVAQKQQDQHADDEEQEEEQPEEEPEEEQEEEQEEQEEEEQEEEQDPQDDDEFEGSRVFPAEVRTAIRLYASLIGEIQTAAKSLAQRRKPVAAALKVIKSYMIETEVDVVKVGAVTLRRKIAEKFKCDRKRFESSGDIPDKIKRAFIRRNTVTEAVVQAK